MATCRRNRLDHPLDPLWTIPRRSGSRSCILLRVVLDKATDTCTVVVGSGFFAGCLVCEKMVEVLGEFSVLIQSTLDTQDLQLHLPLRHAPFGGRNCFR